MTANQRTRPAEFRSDRSSGRTTLGIIGGMGPLATAAFYRTLTVRTAAQRDQDHLHVIIESEPRIPDRTAYLLGDGPDPRPAIIRVARRLDGAGASLLVIPCNTANVFTEDIAEAITTPIVPWIEVTVEAVLAHRPSRVGCLATTGTICTGIYQRAFAQREVETLLPTPDAQRDVMEAIYRRGGVKATGGVSDENYDRLLAAARSLVSTGADVLLLACTELPLAVPGDSPSWPVPAVDPAAAVADFVIEAAGHRPQGPSASLQRQRHARAYGGGDRLAGR